MQIFNVTLGCIVATKVRRADTFWKRLLGWLGRQKPEPGQGLYLTPCNGVHTFGMRFSVITIYISSQGRVLAVRALPPYRLGPWLKKSRGVLEMPFTEDAQAKCRIGDQLQQSDGKGW